MSLVLCCILPNERPPNSAPNQMSKIYSLMQVGYELTYFREVLLALAVTE